MMEEKAQVVLWKEGRRIIDEDDLRNLEDVAMLLQRREVKRSMDERNFFFTKEW